MVGIWSQQGICDTLGIVLKIVIYERGFSPFFTD